MFKCPLVTHFLGLHQIYGSCGSECWQLWNGGMDGRGRGWDDKEEWKEVEGARERSRRGMMK